MELLTNNFLNQFLELFGICVLSLSLVLHLCHESEAAQWFPDFIVHSRREEEYSVDFLITCTIMTMY